MIKRETLVAALDTAFPALAPESEEIVSAFNGYCFKKTGIVAYDDIVGIRVPNPVKEVECVLPGRSLRQFVKSCTSEDVDVRFVEKGTSGKQVCMVTCGKSKLDLTYQACDTYPFSFPPRKADDDPNRPLVLDEDFFVGLRFVSGIVPDEGLSRVEAGVSIITSPDLVLHGVSGMRNCTHTYKPPGLKPKKHWKDAIVPVRFCKAALALHKSLGASVQSRMDLTEKYVVIYFGRAAAVFGRLIVPEVGGINLHSRVTQMIESVSSFSALEEEFVQVLERAASLTKGNDICELASSGGKLKFRTRVPGGVVRDTVTLKTPQPNKEVKLYLPMVVKELQHCEEFSLNDGFICFRGGPFIKITAYGV